MKQSLNRVLLIDNYDSFTYNVYQYLKILEADVDVVYNDKKRELELLLAKNKYTHIVISPGPMDPQKAGLSMEVIERFIGEIPIFGICLGYQCINHFYGGNLIKGNPVHGIVSTIKNDGKGLYDGIPEKMRVTRYHSLNVDKEKISDLLTVDAWLEDSGLVMSFRDDKKAVYGVQYHPEAILSEFGLEILKNFLRIRLK